jgi:hypothetical protein
VEDHCDECGFDARDLTTHEVAGRLLLLPEQVRSVLEGMDDTALRRRPDPRTWSAIEYLGHLRDLMAYHRFLIERATAEERPAVESVDPDTTVASAGYAHASLDDLLGQFARRVDRLVTLIDSLDAEAVDREIALGDREIDVTLVTRSALHEGHHHTLDLTRLARPRP